MICPTTTSLSEHVTPCHMQIKGNFKVSHLTASQIFFATHVPTQTHNRHNVIHFYSLSAIAFKLPVFKF